jgi:putative hydrolase of the HAD superfamily
MAAVDGVLFDLGGVVMESPLHSIARFEAAQGLPAGLINRAIREGQAWSKLERGELTVEGFVEPFEADCRACGATIRAAALMAEIAAAGKPRPVMLEALRRLRARGLRLAALTNNWVSEGPRPSHPVREYFDVFIESSVVGMRKPDPRIYELTCRELAVAPARVAFLDDLGTNLKAARALGIKTIKVADPEPALRELSVLVGFALID